jgi:hypothetical protein
MYAALISALPEICRLVTIPWLGSLFCRLSAFYSMIQISSLRLARVDGQLCLVLLLHSQKARKIMLIIAL